MEIDVLIVLGLALLFFGGVSYLAWKERKRQKLQPAEIPEQFKEKKRKVEERKKRRQ